MKRFVSLLLLLSLLTSCGAPAPLVEGETYLEGTWANDDLRVAYGFRPDGDGTLYIAGEVLLIRYGVKGDTLYLQTGGQTDAHQLVTDGEDLLIDGVRFCPVADDPEADAALSEALAQARSASEAEKSAKRTQSVLFLVTLLAAAGTVAILVRYFRRKKQPKDWR